MSGAFTYLGTSLDSALNLFVAGAVVSVAATLRAPLLLGATASVMVRGFALLRGTRAFSAVDTALELAWQCALISIALSSALYMNNVVAVANGASDSLIGVFAPGSVTGFQALDQLELKSAAIANRYISLGISAFPGGVIDLLTGVAMAFVIAILLIILGGYFLVSKVALALVLCVGPLFVAACAFKSTRQWFGNWLNKIFNYVLLMTLMTATVGLVSVIYGNYLDHLTLVSDNTNPVADLIDLALLSGAIIVMALQMPRMAAALASGSTLSVTSMFVILRAGQGARPPARMPAAAPATTPPNAAATDRARAP